MNTYRIDSAISLDIHPKGKPYLPEDMRGSRYPEAWKCQEWFFKITHQGQSVITDVINSPAGTHPDDIASTAIAFVLGEAEAYLSHGMGTRTPLDGWIFGSAEIAEWCYMHDSEFHVFEDGLRATYFD